MSESRIQDWIRYVQENAENVADGSDASTRDEAPSSGDAPEKTASAEDVSRRVAATLRARRSTAARRENTVASNGETSLEKSNADFAHSEEAAIKRAATRRRQRVETRAQLLERLTNPTITLHETSVILGVCSATVRRLTDCGELPHERTDGGQRRFRLMEVLKFQRDRREAKIARRETKNAK